MMMFQVIVDLNARLDRWNNPTKPLENAHFTYGMNTDYLAKVSPRLSEPQTPGATATMLPRGLSVTRQTPGARPAKLIFADWHKF